MQGQRERFEAWLKSKYGDMFEPIGEDESDTASRLVKIVASEAHKAAEAAAMERAVKEMHKYGWFGAADAIRALAAPGESK
jgi:hypothetical protein